jgi:hypothetical protein
VRKPAPRLIAAILSTGVAVSACALSACTTQPFAAPGPVPPAARPVATASGTSLAAVLKVGLGSGASLGGKQVFPADNAWNTRVDQAGVDAKSAELIASIGLGTTLHPDFGAHWPKGPFGIPYVVVKGKQKKVKVTFTYASESDKGRYPIPKSAPIEGGSKSKGDRHVLVLDRDHWLLYELFNARRVKGTTRWKAGSGAIFDLKSNALRPAGRTSADAAGLPIFPGLVRYDEVKAGVITHALRFTVAQTRRAFVAPARHYASDDVSENLPPMGMRVRLKAGFDISGFPPQARVVLQAMKTYGMIVADNGSNWYVSGAPDKRWSDDQLGTLKSVAGDNFEVVAMGDLTTG